MAPFHIERATAGPRAGRPFSGEGRGRNDSAPTQGPRLRSETIKPVSGRRRPTTSGPGTRGIEIVRSLAFISGVLALGLTGCSVAGAPTTAPVATTAATAPGTRSVAAEPSPLPIDPSLQPVSMTALSAGAEEAP